MAKRRSPALVENDPNGFPSEKFVLQRIKDHFEAHGCHCHEQQPVDLICVCPSDERWHIEAKGVTAQIGLDFRTGLGQLVQRMRCAETRYGLAFPRTDRFLKQCRQVAPWVRQRLNLHWLIVSEDGTVTILAPQEPVI